MQPNHNYKYISFATQLTVGLVVSVFIASWLDKKTGFEFPLFSILLPLAVITVTLIKVIKDASSKK
jgi:Na+/glutamate symporter